MTEAAVRSCVHCGRPLPAGSTARRRFCSTVCRTAHWYRANPAPPRMEFDAQAPASGGPRPLYGYLVGPRAHYHGDARWHTWTLVGHRDNEGWYGDACPEECPAPQPPELYRPAERWRFERPRPEGPAER